MVICNEIVVRSKWTLVNTENGSTKDYRNWPTVIKLETGVYWDINIPFLICGKDNGHF